MTSSADTSADHPSPAGTPVAGAGSPWQRAVAYAAGFNPRALAWGSLVLAALTMLAVNVIGGTALRHVKADLTQENLFTISDGTRKALRSIDEPIVARMYFSKQLGDAAPAYLKYFERVRALLEQYRDISGGRFQ